MTGDDRDRRSGTRVRYGSERISPRRNSLSRLFQLGRTDPFLHLDRCISLLSLREDSSLFNTRRKQVRPLPHKSGERQQSLAERFSLLEITPLGHQALLSVRGRRERNQAFSSPIKAESRAVVVDNSAMAVVVLFTFIHSDRNCSTASQRHGWNVPRRKRLNIMKNSR